MGMSGAEMAARSLLTDALKMMSAEQLAILRDKQSGLLAVLKERGWPKPGETFQQDFMEYLERETLRMADPDKYLRRGGPLNGQPYFICMKCDLPLPWLSLDDDARCPKCQTGKWIGAATIRTQTPERS